MDYNDSFINPTSEQRHEILKASLELAGRPEDYENILELLSPPPDIYNYGSPQTLNNVSIGIIGAGLAGLAAAYELRKLGAAVTLFDAEKDRIGGRIYTQYYNKSKQYFGEFGAMRIPISHETTWHYINLFHLDTESLSSPQSNNFIYAHDVRIRRDLSGQNITEYLYPHYNLTEVERNTPWNQLSDYASDTMLYSLSTGNRTEILKILPEYSNQYSDITKLSTRQVFEILGLSQGAINLLSAVEPLTGSLLNVSHDEIMSSNYSLDFLNTYRLSDGMVNLPLAFLDSLTNDDPPESELPTYFMKKVDIKLGHIVNGISRSFQTNQINLHYNNQKGNDFTESFDYVICAIPFSTLREIQITPLFSNLKMQAIKELNYIDAQKTQFYCRKRFWEEDTDYGRMNGGISLTDLPIQSIIYPPDHIRCENPKDCTYKEPSVLIASYSLGQDSLRLFNQNVHRRFELVKHNVEEVHGLPVGYLDKIVSTHKTVHWNTEQWFRGAFAMSGPGQKVNFLYSMSQPEFNNKVFFAGEHVSTKQGWMQGSLYTGKLAANMVAQQYNQTNDN